MAQTELELPPKFYVREGEEKSLMKARKTILDHPNNHNAVSDSWQELWEVLGTRVGMNPTTIRLEEIPHGRRLVLYLPPEFEGDLGRQRLAKVFTPLTIIENPYLTEKPNLARNPVHNRQEISGWFTTERSLRPLQSGKSQAELISRATSQGRTGMNINAYYLATKISYFLRGGYFDQNLYWSLLPNSYWIAPDFQNPNQFNNVMVQATTYPDNGTLRIYQKYSAQPTEGVRYVELLS